jgi:hypothetical protein
MTFENRAVALEPTDFTPRQTRFIALVALHSRYCRRCRYWELACHSLRLQLVRKTPGRSLALPLMA